MVTVNETLIREILDRLIRIETLVESNQRETNQRFDDVNRRIDETNQSINARIDDVNARIDDTNARIDDVNNRLEETNRRLDDTNRRIDDTNRRIDDTNARVDTVSENQRREFRAEFNKLTYLMLGTGGAIIAAVLTAQFLG